MIKYLLLFLIISFSLECVGVVFKRFCNIQYVTNSLCGLVVFLSISTIFSSFNYFFSFNIQLPVFLTVVIITGISFIYYFFSLLLDLKNKEYKCLLNVAKVIVLAFIIILFLYQLFTSLPHQFGLLENGTKWLSLVNNNFYSREWINIYLETGASDPNFNLECNLGFYYIVSYFMKLIHHIVTINSPIEYCLFVFSPLLLYLCADLFITYIINGLKKKNGKYLIIAFTFLTLIFNFNSLYYGFVGYLYNPLIIGGLLLVLTLHNDNLLKKIITVFIFASALLATSDFSFYILLVIGGIYLLFELFNKCSFNILKNIKIITIICFLLSALVVVLFINNSALFKHYAFDYGNFYLYPHKPIIILSIIVIGMTLFNNDASLLNKVSLLVLNPVTIAYFMSKFNTGFLILDVSFNFGFIHLLINVTSDRLFKLNRDCEMSFSVCYCILCALLLTNSSEDTFNLNTDIEQTNSYEYIYEVRANKDEYDMYLSLNDLTKYETDRVKVISQLPLTSTYVANIELLNGKLHYNSVCQYCDVIAQNLHEPNELTNIFDVREYADNQLYIEKPKYEQTCSLLRSNQYKYLIIRNDQYWNINGNYISIKDALSQCTTIIDSNEVYSLLVVN